MAVVFLPDYTEDNPYQSNLREALDETVIFGDADPFSILRTVSSCDDVSVVHFHWLSPYIFASSTPKTAIQFTLTLFQIIALKIQGIPMVWTVHNVMSHESQYPQLERAFKHIFIRFGFCKALFIHCGSVRESIIQEYNLTEKDVNGRIEIIHHGNYISNYVNEITEEKAKSELGINKSDIVFLYFGQVRPYKGVKRLINEFKSINKPDIRLLVVGNPLNESIKNVVESESATDSRIAATLKYIEDESIQKYMNASDCVVLPYEDITTSGSSILAMSFGKAIVIPDRGCVSELLDDDGSIIYPSNSGKNLRESLIQAFDADLDEMGNHNRQLAQDLTWDDVAEDTSSTYSEVK
jgi:glycosyltransferase involved in cell wall biosynthesis